jgi:hypothetical protein
MRQAWAMLTRRATVFRRIGLRSDVKPKLTKVSSNRG